MDARLPLCKPFFDLPYETRHIIYENIESDAIPPLSTGKEYTGFILSCKHVTVSGGRGGLHCLSRDESQRAYKASHLG
jgi:hypothetical protein